MIITYLRSSSYGCHEMCSMKYFLTYNLGWKEPSNIKAEKGTIVHKALELLGEIKLQQQLGNKSFDDEVVGKVNLSKYTVDGLVEKSYEYYKKYSTNIWKPIDLKHCKAWVAKAIEYRGGEFDPRNAEIVKAEQAFDFEIKKPWAMYDYEMPDGKTLSGFLSLKGTIDQVSKIDDDTYQILDWKGLPVETEIPTPYGWKTMGELKVGDTVFDKDGNHTNVIGKSRKKWKTCYKITFDDTNEVICDDEHLWLLDNGKVTPVYLLEVGDKIDITKPINCNDAQLPIDPYVLGVWLGDGRNRSAEITSEDQFIFDEIQRRGYELGVNQEKRSENLQTRVIKNSTSKLRKLGLLNNKHIPTIYLRSSYNQRLDLLRGLMDTDGNVNPIRKQGVFTTCNKRLSDDVKELLNSLGQRPNQSHIHRDTNFKKGVEIFPLHFRPIKINPFLMPRKANKIDPIWGPGRSNKRTIQKIEILSVTFCTQCIMVDSPSNTYLCTRSMIPTHNTGRRLNWANGKEKDYAALQKDAQLLMYYYAAQSLYPQIPNIEMVIYFINDGGPFRLCFSKEDLPAIENMLKAKFDEIRNTEIPALNKSWKCTKLCHYGKTSFVGTPIKPIIERRDGQVTPKGKPMTKCEQTKYCLEHRTVDAVIQNMSSPGHDVDYYQKPGEVEELK